MIGVIGVAPAEGEVPNGTPGEHGGNMDCKLIGKGAKLYFTIGVEVLYSDYIKEIARTIPDHLLLTETDNPGALRWLKKTDEIGMPTAIKGVVDGVATLRQTGREEITSLVHANFARLIADDPCFKHIHESLFSWPS
jgi:amidase